MIIHDGKGGKRCIQPFASVLYIKLVGELRSIYMVPHTLL